MERRMFDETGYPINLEDLVEITKPMHHREPVRNLGGSVGTVVGIDTIDWRTGEPRGDSLIYVRVEGDLALCLLPPARVRVKQRKKA